jgi:hypothetical protein
MFFKNKSFLVTPVNTPPVFAEQEKADERSTDIPAHINIIAENLIWDVMVAFGVYKVVSTTCNALEHVIVTKVQ